MQAEAQTTEPTAEMDGALDIIADGRSEADGADSATVAAAAQSLTAANQRPVSNTIRWHRAEQGRLQTLHALAISPALKTGIESLTCLKEAAFAAGQRHEHAQRTRGVEHPEVDLLNREWIAAPAHLHSAARTVARAEVRNAQDALVRASAYANGIDNAGDLTANDGMPESDEDVAEMAMSYRSALQTLADQDAVSPALELLLLAYDQADAAYHEASAEHRRREDDLERRAPVPLELQINGLKNVWWRSERMLIAATQPGRKAYPDLTLDQALEKVTILRDFLPVYEAVSAEINLDAAIDAIDAALDERAAAATKIMDYPTTSLAGLSRKLRVFISEWGADQIGDHADNPETIQRKLTATDPTPWGIARVYQDVRRILDGDDLIAGIEPFDAQGFIDRFQAIPGHEINNDGRVQFCDPEAWPGKMSNADFDALFTVRGDRLAIYRDGIKSDPSFEPNPEWTQEDEDRQSSYTAAIISSELIHHAYPDDPTKVAELRKIAARQKVIRNSKPVGYHLWEELSDWQKAAVRTLAQRQAREVAR